MFSIGETSKTTGVKVTTIRYYESIGLIPAPVRTEAGRRMYSDEAVSTLSFIHHARQLGFSLGDIEELITLAAQKTQKCAEVDAIALHHLERIENQIAQLGALKFELERMLTTCEGGNVESCAVLQSLGDHAHCAQESHAKPPSFSN